MKSKIETHRIAHSRLFPLVVIAGFAVVGASLYAFSSAATVDNPTGTADYCRLENNITAIYGWAHDNQAKANSNPKVQVVVGTQSVTVNTSINGYRDNAINDYLTSNGYTPTSQYGFKASFSGIYKGSAPNISGTIINNGAGANKALRVNTGTTIPNAANGGAYFANNKVPDACLPSRPIIPGPGPTPTPTPIPTPNAPTKKPPTPTTKTPAPSPTPETPTATLPTSPNFSLNITLKNKGEALSGITVKLSENEEEAVTSSEGVATFPGLTEASYTIRFDYENNTYEHVLGISTDEMSQAVVEQTVEVSELAPLDQDNQQTDQSAAPKKSGHGWLVVFITLLIAGIIGIIIYVRKRRSGTSTQDYSYPLTTVDTPPQMDQATPPQNPVNNAGVSLKDMVVESMREEAARHHKDDKDHQA